jgi:hypothetical protein
MNTATSLYGQLDAWIDQHFDEQVKFLQALVQVPTDTPPGNNAPPIAPPSCSRLMVTRRKNTLFPKARSRLRAWRASPT